MPQEFAEVPDDRALSREERRLLTWLLDHAEPQGRALLPQVEAARVVSRCGCGCASIDLSVTIEEFLEGADVEQVSADYYWQGPNGGLCGVWAFARHGRLAGLEVWSVDGIETPTELPRVEQLRLKDPRPSS